MYSEQYYPQIALLEITNACNLRCLHCGSASGRCRPNELTLDEFKKVIDELAELKTEQVVVIGGEPFVRRDWAEICAHIRSRGLACCIGSNGTLVTPELIQHALDIDVSSIGVSIDGLEETHDYQRQRKGAFQKTTAALRALTDMTDWERCVVTTMTKRNLPELENIYDHIVAAGCTHWQVQLAAPVGRMDSQQDQMFSDEEYELLLDRLLIIKRESPIKVTIANNVGYFGSKILELRDGMPFIGDYLGLRIVGITSNGDVKGDLALPDEFIEGNIRERSFTDIWKSDDTFSYNRKLSSDMIGGFCRECRYLPLCRGGDATMSFATSGMRANAAYCMYRIEHARGEEPVDNNMTQKLLSQCRISV